MHIKGILTFALGGTILILLWFMLKNATEGIDLILDAIVLGFLGFLLIGIGLSAITEDANKKK